MHRRKNYASAQCSRVPGLIREISLRTDNGDVGPGVWGVISVAKA